MFEYSHAIISLNNKSINLSLGANVKSIFEQLEEDYPSLKDLFNDVKDEIQTKLTDAFMAKLQDFVKKEGVNGNMVALNDFLKTFYEDFGTGVNSKMFLKELLSAHYNKKVQALSEPKRREAHELYQEKVALIMLVSEKPVLLGPLEEFFTNFETDKDRDLFYYMYGNTPGYRNRFNEPDVDLKDYISAYKEIARKIESYPVELGLDLNNEKDINFYNQFWKGFFITCEKLINGKGCDRFSTNGVLKLMDSLLSMYPFFSEPRGEIDVFDLFSIRYLDGDIREELRKKGVSDEQKETLLSELILYLAKAVVPTYIFIIPESLLKNHIRSFVNAFNDPTDKLDPRSLVDAVQVDGSLYSLLRKCIPHRRGAERYYLSIEDKERVGYVLNNDIGRGNSRYKDFPKFVQELAKREHDNQAKYDYSKFVFLHHIIPEQIHSYSFSGSNAKGVTFTPIDLALHSYDPDVYAAHTPFAHHADFWWDYMKTTERPLARKSLLAIVDALKKLQKKALEDEAEIPSRIMPKEMIPVVKAEVSTKIKELNDRISNLEKLATKGDDLITDYINLYYRIYSLFPQKDVLAAGKPVALDMMSDVFDLNPEELNSLSHQLESRSQNVKNYSEIIELIAEIRSSNLSEGGKTSNEVNNLLKKEDFFSAKQATEASHVISHAPSHVSFFGSNRQTTPIMPNVIPPLKTQLENILKDIKNQYEKHEAVIREVGEIFSNLDPDVTIDKVVDKLWNLASTAPINKDPLRIKIFNEVIHQVAHLPIEIPNQTPGL